MEYKQWGKKELRNSRESTEASSLDQKVKERENNFLLFAFLVIIFITLPFIIIIYIFYKSTKINIEKLFRPLPPLLTNRNISENDF